MAPPGLAWLDAFSRSTGAALSQRIVTDVYSSVNPLVYSTRVYWRVPISVDQMLLVWNLFQKWAGRNQTTPSGRLDIEKVILPSGEERILGFKTDVHLRERLGLPKNEHPAR